MSYYPSNKGYIGIASQTNQKTTGQNPTFFVPYTSDEIGPEFDVEVLREGGNGKYDVKSVKTQHRENVSFGCFLYPESGAQILAALLGKDSPTHLTTTPFYHTITVKTTDLATTPQQPWLTVEKTLTTAANSGVHRVVGAKLSEVSIEAEAGMPVSMSVTGTGLTSVQKTTEVADSYETAQPFSMYHGVLALNTPTTTNFDIKSFSVTLRAVNDESIQTESLTRRDIINHRIEAEVTLALNYTDYTLFRKANFGATTTPTEDFSDGSLDLVMTRNAGTTSEERIQINLPKVRLAPHSVNLDPSPNTLEQPLSGMAFKQATTDLVTVTCYNTIATTLPL